MPHTNAIVSFINTHLTEGALNILKPVKAYGIASTISDPENPAATFPGIIDHQGEIQDVVPDDLFNVQFYHKILSNAYSIQKAGSTGDTYDIVCITEMQLFVFGQSDKIRMAADQLEPLFIFGLPGELSAALYAELKIKKCSIVPLSSDMDKARNFKAEYSNLQEFLQPEHLFFSIRYTIKKTFDRKCIDLCLQCSQPLN